MKPADRERLMDLLVRRETDRLDAKEQTELARLLAGDDAASATAEALELEIASAWLAFADQEIEEEPLPDSMQDRLRADADRFFDAAHAGEDRRAADPRGNDASNVPTLDDARPRSDRASWSGWAVAAGLAMFLVLGDRAAAPLADDPGAARSALAAQAADVRVLPWNRSEQAGYETVRGDVVWSSARQAGFLRLAGMPPNDPSQHQYQLWIVDPERDAHPVDGGVFDVAGRSEVIVPVRARLPVAKPRAFAITREQPGGVVVSEGPLLVTATVAY